MNKADRALDEAIENMETRALYRAAEILNRWGSPARNDSMNTTAEEREGYEGAIRALLEKFDPDSPPVGSLLHRWAAAMRNEFLEGMEDVNNVDDSGQAVGHGKLMHLFEKFTKKCGGNDK